MLYRSTIMYLSRPMITTTTDGLARVVQIIWVEEGGTGLWIATSRTSTQCTSIWKITMIMMLKAT